MSMENILVLTVLIYFGIGDLIYAEMTRGVDIPRLDISRILGMWYLLVIHKEDNNIGCMKLIVEPKSAENFVINAISTPTPMAIQQNPTLPNKFADPINCVLRINSNIVICNDEEQFTIAMVAFDVDYDSYMALYATDTEYEITGTGTDGGIIIIGRQPTLFDAIIDRVTQSEFYQQAVNVDNVQLFALTNNQCN